MIHNLSRLYDGSPDIIITHRLRLIDWYLLKPLAETWDITITSAYRTPQAQAMLPAGVKAKGTSQHTLGEAVDLVPDGSMQNCYIWCLEHLRPFQALLEYRGATPSCIHLSIPSAVEGIVAKRLVYYKGLWTQYTGTFPEVA